MFCSGIWVIIIQHQAITWSTADLSSFKLREVKFHEGWKQYLNTTVVKFRPECVDGKQLCTLHDVSVFVIADSVIFHTSKIWLMQFTDYPLAALQSLPRYSKYRINRGWSAYTFGENILIVIRPICIQLKFVCMNHTKQLIKSLVLCMLYNKYAITLIVAYCSRCKIFSHTTSVETHRVTLKRISSNKLSQFWEMMMIILRKCKYILCVVHNQHFPMPYKILASRCLSSHAPSGSLRGIAPSQFALHSIMKI